jgi:hypothetical protein
MSYYFWLGAEADGGPGWASVTWGEQRCRRGGFTAPMVALHGRATPQVLSRLDEIYGHDD